VSISALRILRILSSVPLFACAATAAMWGRSTLANLSPESDSKPSYYLLMGTALLLLAALLVGSALALIKSPRRRVRTWVAASLLLPAGAPPYELLGPIAFVLNGVLLASGLACTAIYLLPDSTRLLGDPSRLN
jgi:4-amino-4-deoxy-L-arabinose transferase-like glycosyltransferase